MIQFDLRLQYLSMLAIEWNYLYYTNLLLWDFSDSSLRKAMYFSSLFFQLLLLSGAVWRASQQVLIIPWQFHLSSGAVWRTSQQVLIIHWQFHLEPICLIWYCLIFLWGTTTALRFFSGASWLIRFTKGSSLDPGEKGFGVGHFCYPHIHCQLPQSIRKFELYFHSCLLRYYHYH